MNLSGQFARGRDDYRSNMMLLRGFAKSQKFLYKRDEKGEGFSTASDSLQRS